MPISCLRCSSELVICGGVGWVLLLEVLDVLLDEMSLTVSCSGWMMDVIVWSGRMGDMWRLYRGAMLMDDVFGFM